MAGRSETMTRRELERLSDLLLKLHETSEDGGLRDEISHVRHEVEERLDRYAMR